LVVDKSQHNLPCSAWSSSPDLPQFSMQILMNDTLPEYLPFLCIGDVIRCHRVRIAARPPRFLNIRQQKHSSVTVFPISLEETAPQAASGAYRPVTLGEHTVTDDDRDRAHALQSWVRERLSRETISNYLATVQELSRSPANRDVVVKVLRVIAGEQVLVVADGSTREALHVKASEPALAGNWLFHHVEAGMWLKLRNCAPGPGANGEECDLVVSAAQVTRMPPWCFDVRSRAANMAARPPIDESAPPEPPPEPAAPAAPQPPARAEGLDEMACAGTGFADTEVDTPPAPEVAEAPVPSPSAVDVTSPIRHRAALSDCAANLGSPLAIARAVDLQSPPKNVLLSTGIGGTGSGGASSSAAPFSMASGGATGSVATLGAAPGTAASSVSLPATAAEIPAAARETLAPGDRVVLFGINRQTRLNGQEGVVVKLYNGEGSRQRWLIRMDSDKQEVALRMTNLRHANPHTVPTQAPAVRAAPLAVPKARLATFYGLHSTVRITELSAALEAGQRSLVLSGFHVERVLTGARGHSLLRARCKVCGASFPWKGGEEKGAKRRRFALPCSHWLFDLAFEFELELRDAAQPNSAIEVAVRDQQGTLFNITPQTAASDPAKLDRAQEMLRHLLAYDGQANAMAVLVEHRYPRDVLVACDTGIVQVG